MCLETLMETQQGNFQCVDTKVKTMEHMFAQKQWHR